jgi:hypothetical protein
MFLRLHLRLCLRVPRAHFQRRPTYSAHLLANKLFDQDNVSEVVKHSQTLSCAISWHRRKQHAQQQE